MGQGAKGTQRVDGEGLEREVRRARMGDGTPLARTPPQDVWRFAGCWRAFWAIGPSLGPNRSRPARSSPPGAGKTDENRECVRERAGNCHKPARMAPVCMSALRLQAGVSCAHGLCRIASPPSRGDGMSILAFPSFRSVNVRPAVVYQTSHPATLALPVLHIAYSSSYMHTHTHSTCMYVMKLRKQGWEGQGGPDQLHVGSWGCLFLVLACMSSSWV